MSNIKNRDNCPRARREEYVPRRGAIHVFDAIPCRRSDGCHTKPTASAWIKNRLAKASRFLAYPNGFRTLTHAKAWCYISLYRFEQGKPKEGDKPPLLVWPTRTDSNRWPSESESDALSSCATGRY